MLGGRSCAGWAVNSPACALGVSVAGCMAVLYFLTCMFPLCRALRLYSMKKKKKKKATFVASSNN